MKQSKKQPVLTRRAILDAAGEGFARQGYAGTGLGEIVSRAELTKGALFHHFADKRSLAVAWISEVLAEEVEEVWLRPLQGIGSLDAFRAFCRSRCLEIRPTDGVSSLVSLIGETAAADSVLGQALEGVFSAWRAGIAAWFEQGKAGGWIHHSIQPAAEAAFLVSAFSGFTITAKANPDEAIRRSCAAALEAYLETLRAS